MTPQDTAEGAACDTPFPERLSLGEVQALLRVSNPYCPAQERDLVIASVHRATAGSDAGLAALLTWYEKRPDYPGADAATGEWRALDTSGDAQVGAGRLCQLVAEWGFDWAEILAQAASESAAEASPNALTRYSLRDDYREVEDVAANRALILDGLVLKGQLTVIYGPPGVGKSAILTELIRRDLQSGVLAPDGILYLDLDNSADGLLDRVRVLKEVGCHVLGAGFRGLTYRKVVPAIEQFIKEGHAQDAVIVVDTVKKLVDLMEKSASTEFAKRLRQLTNAGGTFIGVSHVNKHRLPSGKPVHAGTTDLVEDFDCAYLLYDIAHDPKSNLKTIVFECIKSRGSVVQRKGYQYSTAAGLTYSQLLGSIRAVNLDELGHIEHAQRQRDDQQLVDAIVTAVRGGTVLKMSLVDHVSKETRSSRRQVLDVLDRYCGTDRERHLWDFTVGERGGKSYRLLEDPEDLDKY